MFQQGQKVVCVDGRFPDWASQFYVAFPREGKTYTVRTVGVGCDYGGNPGEIAITLRELVNPKSNKPPHPERAFNAVRFRALEEMTAEEILAFGQAVETKQPAHVDA